MNNTALIIRREYLERVNKKSFIITTILVPLFMVGLMLLPAILAHFASSETKTVAVIDDSGLILPNLKDNSTVRYVSAWTDQKQMLQANSVYGVLVIDRNIVQNPAGVRLLSPNAASGAVEQDITLQVKKIIETEKLKKYNIENLDRILADVNTNVMLRSIGVDEDGNEKENRNADLSAIVGTILNFILYMFLLIYGALVMNSIIEEKNNRVLEIVVSSVKPTQLMLGKIIGVGLVAMTQIVIWGIVILAVATQVLPSILPADMMDQPIGLLTDLGYILRMLGLLGGFLLGGYLFYASIYAAIGASVDNQQDASQLQIIGVMPIIIGLMSSVVVVGDPESTFAVVMSMIPFTSPMVMMARVPFGIPAWQIASSLVILFASIALMIWLAAKIYRVGIFMYGKKPSLRDLLRWARYK